MTRIVVVGDLVTDVIAVAGAPLLTGSDIHAQVTLAGGGSGANTACWLAEAGVDVSLVARVGGDEAGRTRCLELLGAGVDGRVVVDHEAPTGTVVVLVGLDGERTMLADRGAALRLGPADLPAEVFQPGDHLHLSGYVLLHDGSREAGLKAVAAARSARMTISVDAGSAGPLTEAGAAEFVRWTAGVDLLLANGDEAAALTGQADPWLAAASLVDVAGGGYGTVVVKRGPLGALAMTGDGRRHEVPAGVAAVVDTTGAGDAFAAGLLAGWGGHQPDVDAALRAGAELAAQAVSVVGGRPPLP